MALDGVFLRHLKEEIGTSLLGTRVDRVFQPNRDELILAFRGFSAAYKLLISARANSARINLTTIPVENPQQPPMLCMLLRKKLQGAKLLEITQPDLERALMLKFDSVNELGDHVELTAVTGDFAGTSPLVLTLAHPTEAAQDVSLPLARDTAGWRAPAEVDTAHDWNVQLAPENNHWRIRGRLQKDTQASRLAPAIGGG